MGSMAEGDAAFKWVKDFAKNTPLDLEGVSQAFVKLKAFGLDPMDGTLQAITDQTSKLGGSQETLNGIVLALGQAWAKQKLQTEEINQLVERGVPVWEMLSNVTGKNAAELAKMAESGALGRDTIKSLVEEIGRSSEGSSQAMMSSWTGLMSNLGDTWSQFLDRIAQSGAMDYFKSQLQELLRTVEEMANNGQLQQIAQQISDFFVGAAETFRDAVTFVRDYAAEFKALAAIIIGAKIADAVAAIGTSAVKAAEGVGTLAGSMGKLAGVARAGLYAAVANEIFNIVKAYQETQAIEAKTAVTQQQVAEKNATLKQSYADLSEELGLNIQSMADLDKAVADGLVRYNEQTGAWELATQAVRDFDAEVESAAQNQANLSEPAQNTAAEVANAYKVLGIESSDSIKKANDAAKKAYETIKNSGTATAEDLAKAWDAYIAKIEQSNQALAGAKQAAANNSEAGLNQLDTMGVDPAAESANRRQRLTQETIAYEKAMREGDYQEAARIAQQKEELALENAKAEKEAAAAGEIAGYHAYDSRQLYLQSIKDTQKALESMSEAEKEAMNAIQAPDQANNGNGQGEQQQPNTVLQQIENAAEKMQLLKEPIEVNITGNFDEINAKLDDMLAKKATLEGANYSVVNSGNNANYNADAAVSEVLANEVLKRGSRR